MLQMVHERAVRRVTTVLAQELPSKTCYCRNDNGKDKRNGIRGRKRKHLPNLFNEMKRYWKLKEKALYLILWRANSRRNYGPVVRQMTGDDPKSLKRETPDGLS